MPKASPRTYDGMLSASIPKLRRLGGLAEGLAAASGLPASALRSKAGFLEACRRAAGARADLDRLPVLDVVREARKAVGYRVASREDAILIGRACLALRSFKVTVRGPVPARAAKPCGLRRLRVVPWHKDPEIDRAMQARALRFCESWLPRHVLAEPGAGWHAALLTPRLDMACSAPSRRAVSAIVVLDPQARSARCLAVPDGALESIPSGEDGVPAMRAAVAAALASNVTGPAGLPLDGTDNIRQAARLVGSAREGEPDDYQFLMRMRHRLAKANVASLANFRRTLPQEVQDQAGLVGHAFVLPTTAYDFLFGRHGWSLEDYRRTNQAMREVSWLRDFIGRPAVSHAIRSGAPLEAAVRAVFDHRAPLHPKTVRTLQAYWKPARGGRSGQDYLFRLTVLALDAMYRGNPHLRPLKSGEVARSLAIHDAMQHHSPGAHAKAILAHRAPNGVLSGPVADLPDVARWVADACSLILGTQGRAWDRVVHAYIDDVVAEVLYPPHRTLKGLVEANARWHRQIDGFRSARNAFLLAAKERKEARDGAGGPAASVDMLYPHPLPGPTTVDGVLLTPLVAEGAIVEEGRLLQHCVGTYTDQAAAGRSLLVAMSSPDGRSTAEMRACLRTREDGRQEAHLSVVQNRSLRNAPAPESHVRALKAFMDAVPPDEVAALLRRISEAASIVEALGQFHEFISPEDLEGLRDLAFEQLRPFLSGQARGMTRQAWTAGMRARFEGMPEAA